MRPKHQPIQLTREFNRSSKPPEAKSKPSLQDQVKDLKKLLSKPALTFEMSSKGSVNGNIDRDRDRDVRQEIKKLEGRIAKQGVARTAFSSAHRPGTAKQAFNQRSRRR